jgi:hypothetical protein
MSATAPLFLADGQNPWRYPSCHVRFPLTKMCFLDIGNHFSVASVQPHGEFGERQIPINVRAIVC